MTSPPGASRREEFLDVFQAVFRLHVLENETRIDEIEAIILEVGQVVGLIDDVLALPVPQEPRQAGPAFCTAETAGPPAAPQPRQLVPEGCQG